MPDEAQYRQLVNTVSNQSGAVAAMFLQQVYQLAVTKQPCDICLKDGQVFEEVTIGGDFVYALEFEAPVQTVLEMLSEIKLVIADFTPVVRVSLENINAVISMPKKRLTQAEIEATDAKTRLAEKNSKGETLEAFIRKVYHPQNEAQLNHYAARYLAALQRQRDAT